MPELTTVASYPDLPEAELARERLENEGLKAFVLHENSAGVMPFLNTAGIQLQVPTADAGRAKEILGG